LAAFNNHREKFVDVFHSATVVEENYDKDKRYDITR